VDSRKLYRESLPCTKCKHGHQTLLLACGDPQTPDYWQGKQDDDDILADVQSSIREPDDVLVHTASALVVPVPEGGHWVTHEDVSKDAPTTAC
jgi:hypothetical protein